MPPTRGRRSDSPTRRQGSSAGSSAAAGAARFGWAGLLDLLLGSRLVLTAWFVISVLGVVTFAALLLLIARDEVRLDVRHDTAQARVIRTYSQSRGPGGAVVRFTVDGRPVEADVALSWFGDTPHTGATMAIEYDPSHPARARRAGSHDVVGIVVPLVAIAVFASTGWRPWRRRRR